MARLEDIAVAVGVTVTTVANALKGRGNVSPATRTRILECAQELGYRPNELARSLVRGKPSHSGSCSLRLLTRSTRKLLKPLNVLPMSMVIKCSCAILFTTSHVVASILNDW